LLGGVACYLALVDATLKQFPCEKPRFRYALLEHKGQVLTYELHSLIYGFPGVIYQHHGHLRLLCCHEGNPETL
jgi:hypothetical protein